MSNMILVPFFFASIIALKQASLLGLFASAVPLITIAFALFMYSSSTSAGSRQKSATLSRYIKMEDSSLESISVKVSPIFSPFLARVTWIVSMPSFSK